MPEVVLLPANRIPRPDRMLPYSASGENSLAFPWLPALLKIIKTETMPGCFCLIRYALN
jgi:hypothetical protein